MKKLLLCTLLASIALASQAQDRIGDVVKSGENFFIYLTEFKSPEANDEFQRNLSLVQAQNSQLKRLKDQMTATKNEEQKLFLEASMKKLEKEYKQNEKIMGEAYGFASNRVYKQIYFKSNLCIILKKTEIAELKMDDGNPIDPQKMANKGNFSMYRFKEIIGHQENEKLQIALTNLMNKQLEINKFRKQISETKDVVSQKAINEKIVKAEADIKKLDDEIRKAYQIPEKRDYAVEVSNSRLYMLLTPQEVQQVNAQLEKDKKDKK